MSSDSILFQALLLLQQKENVRKAAQKTVHDLVQQAAQQAAQQLSAQQAAHKEREQCSLFMLDTDMLVKFRVSSMQDGEYIKRVNTLRQILDFEKVGGSPKRFVDYLNNDLYGNYELSFSNLSDDLYLQMYWDITSRFSQYAGELLSSVSMGEPDGSDIAESLGCVGYFLLGLELDQDIGFICSSVKSLRASNALAVKCEGSRLNLNLACGDKFGLRLESKSLAIPGALSVAGQISLDRSGSAVGVKKVVATKIESDQEGLGIAHILNEASHFINQYCRDGKLDKTGLGDHDEDKCDTTIKTLAQYVIDFSKQLHEVNEKERLLAEDEQVRKFLIERLELTSSAENSAENETMWSKAMLDLFGALNSKVEYSIDGIKGLDMGDFRKIFEEDFYKDIVRDSMSMKGIKMQCLDGVELSDIWSKYLNHSAYKDKPINETQELSLYHKMQGLAELCGKLDLVNNGSSLDIDFSWFKRMKSFGQAGKYSQNMFNPTAYFLKMKGAIYAGVDGLLGEDAVKNIVLIAFCQSCVATMSDESGGSCELGELVSSGEYGSLSLKNSSVKVTFDLSSFNRIIETRKQPDHGYKVVIGGGSNGKRTVDIEFAKFYIKIPKKDLVSDSGSDSDSVLALNGDEEVDYDVKRVELVDCSLAEEEPSDESSKSFMQVMDCLKSGSIDMDEESEWNLEEELFTKIQGFLQVNGVDLSCEKDGSANDIKDNDIQIDIKPNFFNSKKDSVVAAGGAAGGVLGVVGTMVGIFVANSAVDLTVTAVTIAGTAISGGVLLAVAALVMALVGALAARYRFCKKQCQVGGAQLPQLPQLPLSGVSVISLGLDHQA